MNQCFEYIQRVFIRIKGFSLGREIDLSYRVLDRRTWWVMSLGNYKIRMYVLWRNITGFVVMIYI